MNAFARCNKNKCLTVISTTFLSLLLLTGLQGCFHDDDDPAPVENASGYFTGSATVKAADNMTDLPIIENLQGMVSGNRFMFMSVDEVLLYDGVFTNITDDSFTGTVDIYKDGVLVSDTTTVQGTIAVESSIKGTLTGEGYGNGVFDLTYSLNNAPSVIERIAIDAPSINGWLNIDINSRKNFNAMGISPTGVFSRLGDLPFGSATPDFQGCFFDPNLSKILSIPNINIYRVDITFSGCDSASKNGQYTGFATTQDATDVVLNIAFSNGTFSANALMVRTLPQ